MTQEAKSAIEDMLEGNYFDGSGYEMISGLASIVKISSQEH